MSNIYEYLDISKYLSDKFEEKKQTNSSFSLRAWAQQLGMKSHGPLHAILKGQRNLPKKYIPLISKSLKLSTKETRYIEALTDLQRAKSELEKGQVLEKLKELSPQSIREIHDIATYEYITEPLHIIIAEMIELKDQEDKMYWLKKRLRLNLNIRDIELVINRLTSLNILERINGKLKKNIAHIFTSKEIMSKAVQNYHQKMSQIASEQISLQSLEAREYNAVSFNIKKEDIPQMKQAIREFSDTFIKEFEAAPNEGEETYHINIQLFSLTK